MATCGRCGKRGLFLKLSYRGLCKDCENAAYLEEYRRTQKAIEQAKGKYNELCFVYQKAISGKEAKSTEELGSAIKACDRFSGAVNEFIKMPFTTDVIGEMIKGQNYFYSLPVLGSVNVEMLSDNRVRVDLQEQIEFLARRKGEYIQVLVSTNKFYDLKAALQFVPVETAEDAPQVRNNTILPVTAKNITKSTPISRISNFVVIDTETTGLSPLEDEIIQLTAIQYINLKPAKVFSTYVRPRKGLNPRAQEINGITEEQVGKAPYIEQILPAFTDFLGKKIPLVGHNISFDLNFLQAAGFQYVHIMDRPVYDTLDLAKREFAASSNKLPYLCRTVLKVIRDDAHDAVSDALVTGELFLTICRRRIGEL